MYRVLNAINEFLGLLHYGWKIAFNVSICRIMRWLHVKSLERYNSRLHTSIKYWICERNLSIVNNYIHKENEAIPLSADSPVWVCWWQGEENMPVIIKKCYASIIKHSGIHPVILITEKNYHEYVEIPSYILVKLVKGNLSITHFSDILRSCLLYEYGGIWMDATILLNKDLDYFIPKSIFWTCRHITDNSNVVEGKWTSFFHAGGKGNLLFAYLRDIYFEYWKHEKTLINYYYYDYCFAIAYENILEINKMVNAILPKEMDFLELIKRYNSKYDKTFFNDVCISTSFQKLTYKGHNLKYKNEDLTFYGYLCDFYDPQ